jgi:ABC-type branched-subunit amino acid transport system substrate-binding protein
MGRHRSLAVLFAAVLAVASAACGSRTEGGDTSAPDADGGGKGGGSSAGSSDVGVTGDTITIGVVADLTGVVPGLFKAAPDAVEAFAAMVNEEHGGIHGRELVVEVYDTGTNDNGNRLAYEEACDEVFASVGSESAFDTGGYEAVRDCGFPHLAGFTTDDAVDELPFVFPRTSPDFVNVGAARYLAEQFPEAVRQTAMFYGNLPVTERAARQLMEARRSVGWDFVYEQAVAPLESNYTPHALEMRNRGVQALAVVIDDNNIVRLQKAMREQGFSVEVADVSTQGYSPDYLEAVGPAGEGSYVPLGHALLEDVDQIEALQNYVSWLEEVVPDAQPTSNGLQAWIRAQLFFEAAMAVGPELTREALISELETIADWDAGGLIPPIDVGEPVPEQGCFVLAQVQDGAYVRVFPDEGFHCSPDDIFVPEG